MEIMKKNNTRLWFFVGCFLLMGMLIVSMLSLHGQALELPEATLDDGNKAWGSKIKMQLNDPSNYKHGKGKADDGTTLHFFDIAEEQDINKKDFTLKFTLSGYQMSGADNYEYKQAFVVNPVGVKDHIAVYDDSALTNKQSLSFELTAGFQEGNTNAAPWVNLTFPSGSLEGDKDYYVLFEPEMYATDSANPLKYTLVYHFKTAPLPDEGYGWQGETVQLLWTEPTSDYIATETPSAQTATDGTKYYYNECGRFFCPGKDQTFSFDVKGQGANHIGKEGNEPPANHIFVYSDKDLSEDSLVASAANGKIINVQIGNPKDSNGMKNVSFTILKDTMEDGKDYYLVTDENLETNKQNGTPRIVGAKIITKISAKHDNIQNVPDIPRTCTEDGWTGRTQCETCGSIVAEGQINPASGHYTFNPKQKVATCTEDGWYDVQKCDQCGETYGEYTVIPAKGHTEEVVEGKAATCTEKGLTDGKKCSVCGEWIVKQEEVPALGHKEVALGEAKEATCTEKGMTTGKKCSVCGEILEEQKEIPALGHKEVAIGEAKEATCTEKGMTAGKKCSVCGEVLEAQKEIPAKGHTEEVVKGKAATCTEKGLTDGKKCSVCGEWIVKQEEIPAKGHTEEVVEGKAATCTEKGLTDGKKCSVCGEVLEAQKEISALGHDYKDGKCSRCGQTDPDYKPEEPVAEGRIVKKNPEDGNWYLYNNGKIVWRYTGIAPNQYGWWRIKNGKVDFNATGVFRNEYGWWRVENGKVNFKAQGIYKNAYGWWKTTDGKVTFDETGIFKNEYGWWRVEDSKVNFKADGIYKNQYGWWKTTNGKVTFKENGVFKNEYGWWKVEKSKVNFKFTGIAQNDYGTWYVKNGKVDFSKNGKVTYAGKAYTVTNGKAKLA